MRNKRKIHLIACAVLKLDLEQTASKLGIPLSAEYLPGGLHDRPHELRRRLQEAVDRAVSAWDMIAVGYGLCGSGTVGIRSRRIPLAIPRIHDCISLFLGSDTAYRRQFSRYPGTYYVSAGWVEGKSEPLSQGRGNAAAAARGFPEAEFRRFVAEYGEENAEVIRSFLTSWQRNYQRAVFIDTGLKGQSSLYEKIAGDMAREFGWRYEKIRGSQGLLEKLLTAEKTSEEVLVVPPGQVTFLDPVEARLKAAPEQNLGGVPIRLRSRPVNVRTTRIDASEKPKAGYGLGIDAGGTYTDVVIYEPAANRVVQKAKAPTTRWDFAAGIDAALNRIDSSILCRVRFVSVSTTLATNSIVEGTGRKVGLLVMPPYGWKDLDNFRHAPVAIIDGQMETDGRELAPIDPPQIRRIALDMKTKHEVKAFAVAGYASHANPAHEIEVRRIVREATGLHVTCGYDVSEGLNYRIRAETAALNAGIIPYLEALFEKISASLRRRNVDAPIMVVKSDGSMTSLNEAIARPIETILSGPAASVAGARHMTGRRDALVVDMGGTTTDTALIKAGAVTTCHEGAVVGGWETHVQALDMRTCGLGGDSLLAIVDRKLFVGPRRVLPVSRLAFSRPEVAETLDWMERNLHDGETSTRGLEIVTLSDGVFSPADLSRREKIVIEALRDRPLSLHELARKTEWTAWQLLPIRGLEEKNRVIRCGLTPTDLLHAAGEAALWNADASKRLCAVFARIQRVDAAKFIRESMREVNRRLALEIFRKQLDETLGSRKIEEGAVLEAVFDNAVGRRTDDWSVSIESRLPIVGIGAPIHQFLPEAARILHTEAVIPDDADVANAIGAVTSSVFVHKKVKIGIDESGVYTVRGLPDSPPFQSLKEAERYAVRRLTAVVAEMAERSGAGRQEVEIVADDQIGSTADGAGVFLERTLEARVIAGPVS